MPLFRATMLLLQERIPKATAFYPHAAESPCRAPDGFQRAANADARFHRPPNTPIPGSAAALQRPIPRDGHQRRRRLQPLEGHRRHPLARRHAPATTGGLSAISATVTSGEFWSTAYQPTLQTHGSITKRSSPRPGPSSAAAISIIDTHTEIAVSPEDDIEVRRVTHHQPSRGSAETMDVTSYAEVVLAPAAADASASGVQQSVRANRNPPPAAGDPLHSPAPLQRRASALDVSSDGRAWGQDRRGLL